MNALDQDQRTNEPFDLEREPLERSPGLGIDWGGDGSDLSRPVRAHVLAALRPSTGPYEPPLDVLPTLGLLSEAESEERINGLGIGQEHVPELVRMARDRALATADSETPVVYATDHVLNVLERLDVSDVVTDLLPLFDLDSDLIPFKLFDVLAATGTVTLAPTAAYMHDRTRWMFGRSHAAAALGKIAEQNPKMREQVIAELQKALADAEHDDEIVMTGVTTALIDLEAVEALPLIRHAFEIGKVDEMMNGPWGDVLEQLGVEPEPDDPLIEVSRQRFEQRHDEVFPQRMRDTLAALAQQQQIDQQQGEQREAAQKRKEEKARKQKQKRKTASASRKANRKKRK